MPLILAGALAPLKKRPLLLTLLANTPLPQTVAPLAMARLDFSPLRTSNAPALTWVLPVNLPASVNVKVPLPALIKPPLPMISLRHTELPENVTEKSPHAKLLGPIAALVTSNNPQPNTASTPGAPKSLAPPSSAWRTWSLLKYGKADHTTAAAPDTSGAAYEVPPP